jgi:GNAT-family acetyltransferase (TIGR03103 family)
MPEKERLRHRLERVGSPSLRGWDDTGRKPAKIKGQNAIVDCGWGRLIFGQTFNDSKALALAIEQERKGKRDIAMYLRNPHVVISKDPQGVFLDPSHTFRLWLDRYRPAAGRPRGFIVRLLNDCDDAKAIHNLYLKAHMVAPSADFVCEHRADRTRTYLVAQDRTSGQLIGAVLGVDHKEAFDDPENGSSLWALVVDPQAARPGVGEALVRQLAEHYQARGRSFMDLSVMHDNEGAIKLYEKLDFVRVPVFALKHKNPYNEPLYIASAPEARLNPYAGILVKEARRRGIAVEVIDEEANYFSLSLGGRTIVCRESLTELTSAIAMSRCDDKAVTHRVLSRAGLRVPEQTEASTPEQDEAFLERHAGVVVKPSRGEQGAGISVDVRNAEGLHAAVEEARKHSDRVLIEEFVEGEDLRIIVINFEVVAAAVRRPAKIVGTGQHSIEELIEKQSRRRQAATGGESRIPLDAETERCVLEAGYTLSDILPYGKSLIVRKTANLHTGGTIHDVTNKLSPTLRDAAVQAAVAIDIPVVGLDFLVPSVEGDEYVIVEANERPGLANHEPAPTAERFIDLLFPQTVSNL